MTARFSRIGLDTRTLTTWGTLETRIEGDFGGGAAVSNNALFRLRQAWAELGTAEKTVKVHRARMMRKMRFDSLAELVRAWTVTQPPPPAPPQV